MTVTVTVSLRDVGEPPSRAVAKKRCSVVSSKSSGSCTNTSPDVTFTLNLPPSPVRLKVISLFVPSSSSVASKTSIGSVEVASSGTVRV